jgi:hypothetical protein
MCNRKAVRHNLNPFLEDQKALGIVKPASVLLRPPACDSVTKSCNRTWRKPGDDIECFIGIKFSIKTMPSRGPVSGSGQPKSSPSETHPEQAMCWYKSKTMTSLSEEIFPQGKLDSLVGSWWERETRVPSAETAMTNLRVMGERYESLGGGGNYGREEGGPSRQQ